MQLNSHNPFSNSQLCKSQIIYNEELEEKSNRTQNCLMNFLLTDQILIKKNCHLLFIMNFYLIKRNVVRLEQFSFNWQRFTPTIDKIWIKIVHVVQEIVSHPNVKLYLCVNFVQVCWWAFSSSINVSLEMKKMTNTYKLKHEN
jgi:hypothetical protein